MKGILMMRALAVLLLLAATPFARAVIVYGGDGTGNTTATGAGPGWDYVGVVTTNGASGVYLGSYASGYWVLTAGHVGAGPFSIGGTTHDLTADAPISVPNSDGSAADLLLFRIEGGPDVAPLTLASTSALIGSTVTMIGNGVGRDASLTYWNSGWQETTAPGFYRGYKWSEPQALRWGTNTVATYDVTSGITTKGFTTIFQRTNGSAQATVGDSGGGVFTSAGTLAGIIIAVGTYSSQPGSTSVVNDTTYVADIAQYRSQIMNIISTAPTAVPEPASAALILLAGGAWLGWKRFRKPLRTRPAGPR